MKKVKYRIYRNSGGKYYIKYKEGNKWVKYKQRYYFYYLPLYISEVDSEKKAEKVAKRLFGENREREFPPDQWV